ncbi:polyprotein [Aspergillus tubingensis]|uniref:Polyprotein n=1 Tax=Aspergillus niger TaxID=5061 RepID=A0A100IR42_ASPNG|nr:polyprotein [Aspergillus tubingensis]GAQ45610.1 polyprotein [Aspergillus niger]GFN11559.1 polyprotein [Aspergillus tubingensis]
MRNTFVDLTKYGTCLHNALVYEKEAKDKAASDHAGGYCELLVVAVPNLGNQQYIAFLALPQDCEKRLRPDDYLTVIFDLENSAPETGWRAVIIENISFTPPGFCTLSLTRPWNRETGT